MPELAQVPIALPRWIGNACLVIGSVPPYRISPLAEDFEYGDAIRTLADVVQARFEVWAPGVTDRDSQVMADVLDVQARYRYARTGAFSSRPVNVASRTAETAILAMDLRQFDPWESRRLPPRIERIDFEYYFIVNTVALRPGHAIPFRGVFLSPEVSKTDHSWFVGDIA